MSHPAIQLACLDLAGTTVHDDGAVLRSFEAALAAADLTPDTPTYRRAMDYAQLTMGQSKIDVFQAIFDGDDDRATAANTAFDRAYVEEIHASVEPIDGAAEAIQQFRDRGIKVVLTTGFAPATRDALLESIGWIGLADLVLSPADAGRGRPAPDMILTAVIRLAIDDVRAVAAAGDTTTDLHAGVRAGASLVAGILTGAHSAEQLATAPHTHLLESISDLPDAVSDHNRKDLP